MSGRGRKHFDSEENSPSPGPIVLGFGFVLSPEPIPFLRPSSSLAFVFAHRQQGESPNIPRSSHPILAEYPETPLEVREG